MGLPVLTPQQTAMMREGLSELARARRQGQHKKHRPCTVPLLVSLEKLNMGCIRTVTR